MTPTETLLATTWSEPETPTYDFHDILTNHIETCRENGWWEMRHKLIDVRDFLDGLFDDWPDWVGYKRERLLSTVKAMRDTEQNRALMEAVREKLGCVGFEEKDVSNEI